MNCAVYNRAEQQAILLRARLLRLEAFMATYRELSGDEDLSVEGVANGPADTPEVVHDVEDEAQRVRATPQDQLERIVEKVLVTNGAPLQRVELFERVTALGAIVGGRNEMANFGSKLSRAERLVNLPKLGYWPKNLPFEAGAYHPAVSGNTT